MRWALLIAVLIVLAAGLWVRLAPDDPARWHVSVTGDAAPRQGPCADQVVKVPKGARATCLVQPSPSEALAALDATALATPRTTRLAGSAAEGRITWVSRSRLWGFPDYITAEATRTPQGTRLDILSRQRYGSEDWGVNAARLRVWLASL